MFLRLYHYYINLNTVKTIEIVRERVMEPDPNNLSLENEKFNFYLKVDNDLSIQIIPEDIEKFEKILASENVGLVKLE